MERDPEMGKRAKQAESEPESPFWETVPEPILAKILRGASSPETFAHGLVCKRWLTVGREVQEAFECATEKSSDVVVRGILQFPSLTSVTLEGEAFSDFVLGAVGVHCRELHHVTLQHNYVGPNERPPDLSDHGLELFFKTIKGLTGARSRVHAIWALWCRAPRLHLLPRQAGEPDHRRTHRTPSLRRWVTSHRSRS